MSGSGRYILWLLLVGFFAMMIVVAASFLSFVENLETSEPEDPAGAQGIVVLTGGADRLADGLRLLENGKAKRLLLSGVHRNTTLNELKRLLPMHAETLACCTDLGYEAGNTRGNAAETAAWAKSHGFSQLIVVTASYHLPRVKLEFARALPGLSLTYYPVVPDSAGLKVWWREPALLRILVLEYAKFRLAQVRLMLGIASPATRAP